MTKPLPSVPDMLTAIGWAEIPVADNNGNRYAVDTDNGAVRISNGWGPDWTPAGYFACGSRGPRGRWPTFEEAVAAAYRHHVLGEPEAPLPEALKVETVTIPAAELARLQGVERAAKVVCALPRVGAPTEQADGASIAFYRCCGRPEYRPHADDCRWLRVDRAMDALDEVVTAPTAPPDAREERVRVLLDMLDRGVDIVSEYAPGHSVWLAEARAALGSPS